LRDRQWDAACRVDLPLQGPRSRDVVLALVDPADTELAARIKALRRTQLTEGKLAGIECVISRSGYTGETMAFELFAHPDRVPELWNAILQAGQPFGVRPVGLGARDSLRTEAGLPLYGHELAGPLGLDPNDAGLGHYAKLYKPFFIGRAAFIQHDQTRVGEIARFRMNEKNVRMPKPFDLVVDVRGKVIGKVTSCAIDTEGYLTGLAYVLRDAQAEGQAIFIAPLSNRDERPRSQLTLGDKVPLLDGATVISRFPKRK
jgi:glycine hydroxymethyltransferase